MRTWVFCSAAAAALACAGIPQAADAQTLPVTIINKTGIKGKMYITVLGRSPQNPAIHIYSDVNGNTKQFTVNPTPTDYGFSTTALSYTFKIPQINSGRIYVSFCAPAWTTASQTGDTPPQIAPNTPATWVPTNKNFNTVLDFAEFDWVPSGSTTSMDIDTTQVDALSIPMTLSLSGTPGGRATTFTSGFKDQTTSTKVVPALASAPWNKLVVYDTRKRPIRILVPEKAMALPSSHPNYFPNNYLSSYIGQVFSKFATPGQTFTITGDDGTLYTGKIQNNQIVLKPNNGNPANVFGKPSTVYVWQNGAPPVSGPAATAPQLQKYIQAAFLRSTFLNTTTNSLSTCQGVVPYSLPPQNLYSRTIHALSINQGAYTFPYDDVCARSSNISLTSPTSVTLTLLPLSTSMSSMTCN
ncbi:glycoside hydrolase family 64 protein [Xanthobacter sp. V3C-4]|uniref:glycoside hydrolase family 64 protein n=1 Tax=Xanthobacter autotrophicus (strain ATCC BAA-1158 / Py2) TaxID=78245 RepID=UPI0037262FFE